MSAKRLDLLQPQEVLDYRSSELAIQDRILKTLEERLANPELPPDIVWADTMRLERTKATFLLYNDLMNGYVHALIYMDKAAQLMKE